MGTDARARWDRPVQATGRPQRVWLITVLATVASTYALDAFATAAGAALVASGLLGGVDGPLLLALLAATYVLWGAGMRANLAANWALLESTGASTNMFSKGAYDIAAARRASPQVRRFAASGGYVTAELLKEVPYYAGAFGAALAIDDVSGADAVVFLAGTNVGAAVYEYGIAGLTRALLRRRLDSSGAVALGSPNNHVAGVRARAEEPKPDDLSQRHPRRAAGGVRRR
jgi:hypothetical protein